MRVCHAAHTLALCLLGYISSLFYELCIHLTPSRCPAMMLLSPCGHQDWSHYASAYACILHYLMLCMHFLSLKVQGNCEPIFGEERLGEAGRDMSSLHPLVTWGSCTNVSQMCILCISHLKNKIKLTSKMCFISQNNVILDTFPHFTDLNHMFKDHTSSLYKIGKIIIKIVHD